MSARLMRLAYFFLVRRKAVTEMVQITRFPSSEYYELMRKLDDRGKAKFLEPQMPMEHAAASVAMSVSARSKQQPPDCKTCGACCVLPLVVAVDHGDEKRLEEYWDITTDDFVIERVLGRNTETGHCLHLDGTLGQQVCCTIYPNRPNTCRVFEAGSDRCLEYRRMCGIDRQLTEEELQREHASKRLVRNGIITGSDIGVASVSTSIRPADDGSGGFVATRKTEMRISVAVDRNSEDQIDLHRYDPTLEEWHQSEFYGLTLDEAQSVIRERKFTEV